MAWWYKRLNTISVSSTSLSSLGSSHCGLVEQLYQQGETCVDVGANVMLLAKLAMFFRDPVRGYLLVLLMAGGPSQLSAEERWDVLGDKLVFNMNIPYENEPYTVGLISRDTEVLANLLAGGLEVKTFSVTGDGGFGPAADKMADTILRFRLDTKAYGDCLSACAKIFLAGEHRYLEEGATLGFHRPYVLGDEERAYFMAHRLERGWRDEFDYVEFIYDVGLTNMLDDVKFMISRGVAFNFIEEAYSHSGFEMWRPERELLAKGGVLRSR